MLESNPTRKDKCEDVLFEKLFEKGIDIFEALELIGISQNDIELINDAAYVWQYKHL